MRFRFKCPLCNWLVWSSALESPVQFYFRVTESGGRGQIKNVTVPPKPEWLIAFAERFYEVTQFLLDKEVISAERITGIIQENGTEQQTEEKADLDTGFTVRTVDSFIKNNQMKVKEEPSPENELEGDLEIEVDRPRDSEDS